MTYLLLTVTDFGPVCTGHETPEARDAEVRRMLTDGFDATEDDVFFIDPEERLVGGFQAYRPNLDEYEEPNPDTTTDKGWQMGGGVKIIRQNASCVDIEVTPRLTFMFTGGSNFRSYLVFHVAEEVLHVDLSVKPAYVNSTEVTDNRAHIYLSSGQKLQLDRTREGVTLALFGAVNGDEALDTWGRTFEALGELTEETEAKR